MFLLRQFLFTIPNEIFDSARIDGANDLRILCYKIVPLMKPSLATVGLYTFVTTYRDLLESLIYLTNKDQWTTSLGLNKISKYVWCAMAINDGCFSS